MNPQVQWSREPASLDQQDSPCGGEVLHSRRRQHARATLYRHTRAAASVSRNFVNQLVPSW